MKYGILILLMLMLSTSVTFAQQPQQPPPPPPIAGAPGVTWGMSPEQVSAKAPGKMEAEIYLYRMDFAGYDAQAQYFFADNRLVQTTILPHYAYDDRQKWQPEFRHITQFLTDQYGNPVTTNPNMLIWRPAGVPTQATLVLYPNSGWSTRFDQRR